jgi:glycosyltransferase involved in cell wall biosynthesis
MISPAFAPFANAEAIVNSKLALAMLEAGWDVDIITRDFVGASTYDYGSAWIEPWLQLRAHTHEISYKSGGRLSRVIDIVRCTSKVYFPIDGCRWAARAYDIALAMYEKKPFDVIISRAFPQYAHLPAMIFYRKTRVPWIASWNDPWLFLREKIVRGNLRKNIGYMNSYFCKKISRDASWHTFPTEKLRIRMSDYLGKNILEKSSFIPHVAIKQDTKYTKDNKRLFKITYSGCISRSQDPKIFLKALALFIRENNASSRVLFEFIGIDPLGIEEIASEFGVRENVKYIGKYNYNEQLKRIAESEVLLVIDPYYTEGIIMPSKFVDYVQTGRPVLAITPNVSTLREIISSEGGGIVADYDSAEEISHALTELYRHWLDDTLDRTYGSIKLYHLFSPEKIISLFSKIFAQIGIKNKVIATV